MRRRVGVFSVALWVVLVGLFQPSTTWGLTSLAFVAGGSDVLYVENDGEIYELDMRDFRRHGADYGRGEGSYEVTLYRAIFRDSPERKSLEFGKAPLGAMRILGSEPRFVEELTGRHPAEAYGRVPVATVRMERRGGISATSIRVGRDELRLRIPEAVLEDPKIYGGRPTFTLAINGVSVRLGASEWAAIDALLHGRTAAEDYTPPPELVEAVAAFEDPADFGNGAMGLALIGETLRADPPAGVLVDAGCVIVNCGVSCAGGVTLAIVEVAAATTVCGPLCAFVIAGTIATAGAGCGQCAVCFDGNGGTGTGGNGGCPPSCGGSGEIPCPDGCCPDGSPAGPDGCGGGGDDDDCDPATDPDGCTCPVALGCN